MENSKADDLSVMDRAGVAYWDKIWSEKSKQKYNPYAYDNADLTKIIDKWLINTNKSDSVIEIGCADSIILPYINSMGYPTVGVDYSQAGCEKFAAQSPGSELHCADMFSPPEHLIGRAGALISMGLVEHFNDTRAAVAALAGFLKPGGTMLTVIPNMYGSVGFLQRVLNRTAYDVHVRLSPDDLADAHAGLVDVRSGYLSAVGYGVVNHGYKMPGRLIVAGLARFSTLLAGIDNHLGLPRTRAFSPHCWCIATKPA